MVLLHVKRSDKDSFLVETSVTESNDDLIRRLVNRHILLVQTGFGGLVWCLMQAAIILLGMSVCVCVKPGLG